MALHALSRMETRKYQSGSSESSSKREENGNISDTESTLSTQSDGTNSKCVICLEKFKDGQVITCSFSLVVSTVKNLQGLQFNGFYILNGPYTKWWYQ